MYVVVISHTSTCTHTDDVITEQAILKWYNEAHIAKGKSVFLEKMKPMVEWLQTAEEESDSETKS